MLQVSPVKGTVGFASAQSGWSFTLQSFSKLYCEVYGIQLDHPEFARRLWGDVYFHPGDPPCLCWNGPRGFGQVAAATLHDSFHRFGYLCHHAESFYGKLLRLIALCIQSYRHSGSDVLVLSWMRAPLSSTLCILGM